MKKMIFAMSLIAASVLSGSPTPPDGGTGMRLACQMWGVKDFWEKDPERGFAEVFPKLRAMGYEGVQSMAFWKIDPDRLEALLKANGLALADMPVSFDHIEGANVDKTVAFCRRFGVDFVYVPWFKGQTSAEWRDFCKRLSAAGRRLRPYGIRVGYHNHLHEFTVQLQNEFPADILKSDREVNLELDIGPVAESGRDAPTWISDLSGRVPGLHAKPYGASAVGAPGDVQNWPKVIDAARRAGVKWFVVECEQRKNTYDDVAASAAYLKGVWNAAPPPERKPRVVMNLVNFVRGCEPRRPMDLVTPVAEQIRCNRRYGMPSTILMQYDAMLRDDIMAAAATADRSNTEFGVWIEIVKPLCEAVGIAWRGRKDWAWDWWVCPGFLEAYTQEQRAKLIDELFRLFKEKFGATPKSVGSWVMDAWSIAYMKEKYGIVAVCVCREEDVTDAYGLRGGYSNGGYYPSRLNMLSAASDMANAVKVPVFKMLTPDPIYNYGFKFVYHDSRTGKERRHVVTLEPAGLGKEPYIVDWYFRAYTEPRGMLNLSYMQTGQENSFGWTEYGVNVGYNCQLEELKRYVDRGQVEVETLGDTGRRFLADHAENCAQTQVALDDWMGQGRRSVWYNCKNYRANLYQEGNRFYIRDIHKMCDGFAEDHISTASTNWNELLFTPPVVDAYLFRTNGAPGMLAFTGQATGMTPRATGPNELEVACAYADGTFTLVRFDEGGITVFGMPLEIKMNDEWRRNHGFSPGRINLVFKDFRYAVGYEGRLAQTRDGYRIEPENGRIRFDLSIKDGR